MPIPNVPLNMDQFGFAGRMTPSMGGPMSGFGRGFGAGPSGLMELLRKQQAMKDAIAKAQLDAMRAETNQYRKGSSLENAMREAELKRMNYPMQAPGPDLRREYLGEQMRKGGFSPLGFGGYSMQNAMKQMALAGEGEGQARFDNDSNALGGGAPPNFARQLQVDRLADQHARSLMNPYSARGTPRGSLPPVQSFQPSFMQYAQQHGKGRGKGGVSYIGKIRQSEPPSNEKGTLPSYQKGSLGDAALKEALEAEALGDAPGFTRGDVILEELPGGGKRVGRYRGRAGNTTAWVEAPLAVEGQQAFKRAASTTKPSLISKLKNLSKVHGTFGVDVLLEPLFGLISNQPEGQELLRSIGVNVPPTMYKTGSLPGTVPKTGPYKLHKGEIVISAPQVDEPLLSFLVEDKLRKGITKSTPKGSNSYKSGSVGSDILPPRIDPFSVRTETGPEGLGGRTFSKKYWEDFRKSFKEQKKKDAKETDIPLLSALARDLGQGAGVIGRGVGGLLGGLGDLAGDIGTGYDIGAGTAPPPTPAVGMHTVPQERALPTDIPMASAEEIGPALAEDRYQQDLEAALSRVGAGDFGTRENPLTVRGEGRAPMAPRGDEHLPPEQRYFAPEEPEWRAAQDQKMGAIRAREKAEKLRSFLMDPNQQIDPDTRKELFAEAKWHDQIADTVEERFEKRRERSEAKVTKMDELVAAYDIEEMKARAKGEEVIEAKRDRHLGEMERHYNALAKDYADPKNVDEDRGPLLKAMAAAMMRISDAQDKPLTQPQAEIAVLAQMGEFDEVRARLDDLGVSPEKIEETIAAFGGA